MTKPNFTRLALENEGEHAFRIGLSHWDCPYDHDSVEWDYWIAGWSEAALDARAQRHIEGRA